MNQTVYEELMRIKLSEDFKILCSSDEKSYLVLDKERFVKVYYAVVILTDLGDSYLETTATLKIETETYGSYGMKMCTVITSSNNWKTLFSKDFKMKSYIDRSLDDLMSKELDRQTRRSDTIMWRSKTNTCISASKSKPMQLCCHVNGEWFLYK
jgi:hypothetical protein